jgi:hypothetical protein
MLEDVLTRLKTIRPAYLYLEQGGQALPYFTLWPVSTTPSYSVSCVGSIGDEELVQLDAWAESLTEALELDRQAVEMLEAAGYTLGAPTRTLKENNTHRRVLTVRRRI